MHRKSVSFGYRPRSSSQAVRFVHRSKRTWVAISAEMRSSSFAPTPTRIKCSIYFTHLLFMLQMTAGAEAGYTAKKKKKFFFLKPFNPGLLTITSRASPPARGINIYCPQSSHFITLASDFEADKDFKTVEITLSWNIYQRLIIWSCFSKAPQCTSQFPNKNTLEVLHGPY